MTASRTASAGRTLRPGPEALGCLGRSSRHSARNVEALLMAILLPHRRHPAEPGGLHLVAGGPPGSCGEEPPPKRAVDGHHDALPEPARHPAGAARPARDVDRVDPCPPLPRLDRKST